MICQNCNHEFKGNFCNNCGQKSTVKRIDFKYLINEIPDSILQMNRGFLFTVKELITRPGHSIRDFLNGKRKHHYKPIAFLLVTATLYVLSTYLMNRKTFLVDFFLGFVQGGTDTDQVSDSSMLIWISENEIYFILLFLPLFSIASYLAFSKSKLNYFEHLVANLYITGQQMLIYLVFGLIFFKDNIFQILPIIIGVFYNFWAFNQLFENKKISTKFGLIVLTYLIFLLEIFIVSFVAIGILDVFNS